MSTREFASFNFTIFGRPYEARVGKSVPSVLHIEFDQSGCNEISVHLGDEDLARRLCDAINAAIRPAAPAVLETFSEAAE
ncbi:UNVERIFIED_ORG: hypothetical protein ABID33_000218 [Xanthobacter viscosus]|uniref:Uncharacterized protein n=1 Tax=Xanthobacter autotrophicus TaxID=280 RepID=A0A6C1KTN4_XANAU|nr:hypothetical protein [Xanthobacter autotrophicus]TLX43886.1 hypothetical protein FBQ73_07240 [Xanthobacter autotrophicus]